MTAPSLAYQLDAASSGSSKVEFRPGVREEILAAALTAQTEAVPGIPLAGVLLGHCTDGVTQVTGWVSLGSARTHDELEPALKLEVARQKKTGNVAVGWFRSQHSGGSRATGEDLQLFSRVFNKRWQLTLIVRPAYRRPAQLALYLRDAKGLLRPDRPSESFFLFPAPVTRPQAHPMVTALAGFLEKRYSPWLAVGMAVAGLMIGGLGAAQRVNAAGPEPLAVKESLSTWDITWDRTLGWSPAARGHIEVREGTRPAALYDLNPMDLREGHLSVLRHPKAKDVALALTVQQPGGRVVVERTRLVSQATLAR